jgi:hypothetical protein
MLNKEICWRCLNSQRPEWARGGMSDEVFREAFEARWNKGFVQCDGGRSEDHPGWTQTTAAIPNWCLYELEQMLNNAK